MLEVISRKVKNTLRGTSHSLCYFTADNNNDSNNQKDLISWTLDSGASYHMTHNLKCLENIQKHNELITFADGETVESKYKGTYTGFINESKIILKDVLYIPSFKRSLMSIHQLSDKHFKIIFFNHNNKNKVSLFDKKGNKICNVNSTSNNIYKIWSFSNKINFNENNNYVCNSIEVDNYNVLKLWHRRLAHFSLDKIKDRLPKIDLRNKCEVCSESKMRNLPYYLSANKTKEIFEMIHMDTVQYSDESLHGNKYFFTIMDDYSRYGWVFCVKSKADVFPTFHNWYKKVINIFNKNIKYIKTDNGGEFINSKFEEFCNEKGIMKYESIPHNPQQNGKAERLQL